ncbi:ThiF family adenylyltransferase [Nocardioides sp. MH1]|uniref:HesA/MoeB/ThiF family protein n=1 Tax=Nocardioides sp. MH1 TaxID=3242490 RepID=UPI0035227772
MHEEDWAPEWTVVRLLREQVPKLLRTGAQPAGSPPVAASSTPPSWPDEIAVPEPVSGQRPFDGPTVLVPDEPVPSGVEQGALVVRFTFGLREELLGTGLVTSVLGEDIAVHCGVPDATWRQRFPVVSLGRWIRHPDYDPAEPAAALWRRVIPRLAPVPEPQVDPSILPGVDREVETVGLLVPDEVGFGSMGESWVFLIRVRCRDGGGAQARHQLRLGTSQHLVRPSAAVRTPANAALGARSVVVVGLGALGCHVAHDLGFSGVGSLALVDHDIVDVATASRQPAPATWAGEPKSVLIAAQIRAANPWSEVIGYQVDVGSAWDRFRRAELEETLDNLNRRLVKADLVIDATANRAVTRWLSAVRRQQGAPFLHVSATAGVFGGVVALLTSASGCWECVERWRAASASQPTDARLPVPGADPHGWVNPPRCSSVAFTGNRPDLATISHHASRVAMHHLVGDGDLGGNYFVADLRDENGHPSPVRWRSVQLRAHPQCPFHD